MWKKIKGLKNKMMEIGLIPMDKDFFMNEYGKFRSLEDLTRIKMKTKIDKKNTIFLFLVIYTFSFIFILFGLNPKDTFLSSLEAIMMSLTVILFICVFALYNNDVQIHCCEETIEIISKNIKEIKTSKGEN